VSGGVGSTEPLESAGAGSAGAEAGTWEPVIGLEIHVHLKTRTKMFCSCELEYGAEPNVRTCPVCLAYPGALPVPNAKAIEHAVKLGLALGCEIAPRALFHRKNYFYPDNPKGYQISQYDVPLSANGKLVVPLADGEHVVGITRAHLEEDAAKTVHVGGGTGRKVGSAHSLVDFNRGGTPLVEIVTEPDIRSSEEARRFLQLLRQTIVELGISDAEMEKGTLRVDANVSVRKPGEGFRTRWELKNVNSFNYVARGIEAAIREQVAIYEAGGTVEQHTYDYEPDTDTLTPHRSKEEADDYRYFPEPDLVPVEYPSDEIERLRSSLGELPGTRIRRYGAALDFDTAAALVTTGRDRLYEQIAEHVEPRTAANVVMNEAAALDPERVNAPELAKVIAARADLPREVYLRAIEESTADGFSAETYLAQRAVADAGELDPIIDRILDANPGQVAAFRSGKEGLLGFFVGQVMKETGGKANAKVVNERIREKLSA
jgi:aspartyl-tRNA(Asn)/glutamyl-tRNA(Gln) amidotransferase subunit B